MHSAVSSLRQPQNLKDYKHSLGRNPANLGKQSANRALPIPSFLRSPIVCMPV